jgi:hypothetical protein
MGLFVALGLATCGGDDGGSCGKILPCGGDPTGTWMIRRACPSDLFALSAAFDATARLSCLGAAVPVADSNVTGTLTFRADGTYDDVETSTFNLAIEVPASCVPAGTSCAQVAEALRQDPNVVSGTCSASFTGCTCREVSRANASAHGAAATSGTTLTLTPLNGPESSTQYCVSGNELHLVQRGGFALPGNHIVSDVFATRN